MFSSICSGTIYGLQSHLIQVEVDVSRGLPCLIMVGSLGSEVRESQERVKVALKNSGMDIPPSHISVNLSPADIHKAGTGFDLAIALGILTATEIMDAEVLADVFVIGELGLSGEIKGVKGVLPLVWEAFRQGKKQCLVPRDNFAEASVIEGIRVAGAGSIQEACDYLHLSEEEQIREESDQRRQETENQKEWNKRNLLQEEKTLDFAEVHGQEKRSAITSIETKINGKQTIKCVGKNPRLASAKSKNDKNIAGLESSMNENKLSIYTYVNALKIGVGAEKTSVINIEFASGDETNAEFHAEVILDVKSNAVSRKVDAETTIEIGEENKVISIPVNWTDDGKTLLKAYYVLDGKEVEQFHPSETWFSGKHLLNLYYPIIEMKANELHTFEVLIELTNGTATIEPQNAMATISGQGLGAQERWDGRITVDEEIKMVELSGLPTNTIHDKVVAALIAPKKTGITQHIDSIRMTGLMVPEFYDNISFFVPIVRDVIETADRDKMVYQRAYVEDDKQFLLRKSYFLSGGNYIIMDRGRAISLTIDTEPFQELTDIKIQPFETSPFVNKHKTKAEGLETNHYTSLSSGQMVLIQDYKERIEGVVEEMDKGTMASFDLGFDKFDEVTTVEVHNG